MCHSVPTSNSSFHDAAAAQNSSTRVGRLCRNAQRLKRVQRPRLDTCLRIAGLDLNVDAGEDLVHVDVLVLRVVQQYLPSTPQGRHGPSPSTPSPRPRARA